MTQRPGLAYRRPDGDPSRLVIEAGNDPRIEVEERPDSGWLEGVAPSDRDRLCDALETGTVDVVYRVTTGEKTQWIHELGREDGGGDVIGYLFPADERVERRRKLERQRERLDEFASVVSHDLRNPLAVAVGNVELARELDGDDAAERLDRAHDALERMDDLISDLLALAREGKTVETAEPTDLGAVVEDAWRTVGAGNDAALVIEDPLPVVSCDPNRVRQTFENLFRNALEHGTPADVAIAPASTSENPGQRDEITPGTFDQPEALATGRASTADGEDPLVRVFVGRTAEGFYVADDGPGIDPDDRDAVFDPGHTTDPDGTGFGLAIVERIAEAHGWEVSVTASREGGARFEFAGIDPVDPAAAESVGGDPSIDESASQRPTDATRDRAP